MRVKRFILLVAIIVIVVLLYKFPFKEPAAGEAEKTKTTDEFPDIDLTKKEKVDPDAAAFGDLLKINFILKIQETGEVVDTNNPALAEQYNLTNYVKGPYSFILGNSDKLKDKNFDRALIGWKLGEKRTVNIAPSEDELFIKINRTKVKDLYFNIPRYQRLPLSKFKKLFGKEAVIDDTVSNPDFPWSFKIFDIKENSAVGDPVVKENEEYNLPTLPWPVKVSYISDKFIQLKQIPDSSKPYLTDFGLANITASSRKLMVHYNPVEGSIIDYDVSLGPVNIPAKFKVLDVTPSDFVIHRIDNLNDKWLTLEAEILERIPDVKHVKNESILDKAATEKVSRQT